MKKFYIYVLLLAGGIGTRTKSKVPKQLVPVKNHPLAEYSIIRFMQWISSIKGKQIQNFVIIPKTIVFVSHSDYLEECKQLFSSYPLEFIEGGKTRHDSTRKGLQYIRNLYSSFLWENTMIYIHDVARPIFLYEEIQAMLEVFLKDKKIGSVSLATPVSETIIQVDTSAKLKKTFPRNEMFMVKTPQALRGVYIDLFIQSPEKDSYTDLLTWAKAQQISSKIVHGIPENIKVTYPFDFSYVEFLLKHSRFSVDFSSLYRDFI